MKPARSKKQVNFVIGPIHLLPEMVEDAHGKLPPRFKLAKPVSAPRPKKKSSKGLKK